MFRFWSTRYVRHLEAEIEYLRGQMEHERQRAEIAVNELLRVRVNAGPVALPTPREAAAMETLAEKLMKDPEFMAAGVSDEVERIERTS